MTSSPESSLKPEMLSDSVLELIGARFRALGEPSRLKLLRSLMGGEKTVGQLTRLAGLTQANASRHLQTLTEAGILARRKQGLNVVYFIEDDSIGTLCQHVCAMVQRRHASHAKTLRAVESLAPRHPARPPKPGKSRGQAWRGVAAT